jgi:hypothetical protein
VGSWLGHALDSGRERRCPAVNELKVPVSSVTVLTGSLAERRWRVTQLFIVSRSHSL